MKRLFALIFTLILTFTLAAPAYAIGDPAAALVNVVNYDGSYMTYTIELEETSTVYKVLKKVPSVATSSSKQTITSVNDMTSKDINSPFDGSWVVALNGKIATFEDEVNAGDILSVYWNEPELNTRLVQAERIQSDVIQFFYYKDGNRVELQNLNVSMTCNGESMIDALSQSNIFITNERGYIWLATNYLDDPSYVLTITTVSENLEEIALSEKDGYTKEQVEYFNARKGHSLITCESVGKTFTTDFTNVVPNTGDFTAWYAFAGAVLVGCVVIIVLATSKDKRNKP